MSPANKRARKQTQAPAPEQFFSQLCPPLLRSMRSLCAEMGGSYAIVVEGAGGGAWTLDFAGAEVRAGGDGANVTLTMSPERFASLSSARVELRKLVADGEVSCEGDPGRLENLSFVLAFLQRG